MVSFSELLDSLTAKFQRLQEQNVELQERSCLLDRENTRLRSLVCQQTALQRENHDVSPWLSNHSKQSWLGIPPKQPLENHEEYIRSDTDGVSNGEANAGVAALSPDPSDALALKCKKESPLSPAYSGSPRVPNGQFRKAQSGSSGTLIRMTSFDDDDRLRKTAAHNEAQEWDEATTNSQETIWKSSLPMWRANLNTFVDSHHFELFFAVTIISNAMYMGVEVDFTSPGQDTPVEFTVIRSVYTTLFTVELILRLLAQGCHFFRSEQWGWNCLDMLIVSSSVIETFLEIIRHVGSEHMGSIQSMSHIRLVRIIRITRLLRVFRITRIVRFVRALRTLVYSIIGTLKSLVWALLLLFMIIYVFAIIFTQATVDYMLTDTGKKIDLRELGPNGEALHRYWSTLPRSMFTLFKAICDGMSWEQAIAPLSDVHWICVGLFTAYIAFASFAVLNVVTGVFCQSAIESAQHDLEMTIQSHITNKKMHVARIKRLFKEIDSDESGHITIKEFERHLRDESVQAYFESLELDPSDAWTLFKLLDWDASHAIDIDEFVLGCMRLKGAARSADIARLTYEHKWLITRMTSFIRYTEEQFALLREHLEYVQPNRSSTEDDMQCSVGT